MYELINAIVYEAGFAKFWGVNYLNYAVDTGDCSWRSAYVHVALVSMAKQTIRPSNVFEIAAY